MSDVVRSIERSFRELLTEKRYRSVTVKDICERAHVSRKTFYANFHDKEDIITYIFERDVLGPLRSFNDLFSIDEAHGLTPVIQRKIYQAVQDDGAYYKNLVSPMKGHDDTFIRVVTNAVYKLDIEVLSRHGFDVNGQKADYIAYFYASSQAMLMQKWICDGFAMPVDDLSDLYISMTLGFWPQTFGRA